MSIFDGDWWNDPPTAEKVRRFKKAWAKFGIPMARSAAATLDQLVWEAIQEGSPYTTVKWDKPRMVWTRAAL